MNKDRVITIRNTHESDADAVAATAPAQWTAIHAEYRKILGDTLYESVHGDDFVKKETTVRTAMLSNRCLVAESEGEICSFCSYRLDGTVEIISNNAVSSDNKGNGYVAVKATTGLDDGHAPARRAYKKAGCELGREYVTYCKML